ncbi:class I SAM-dependent methyltransferase [Patiriisocius sp. Uisw_017]|uniref:class I SAM-dependent methyltransferase n=1 Tax=Patiriisocius sp. Uisw_017 TaxID=3230968 RepID=UPI0039ED4CE4
MIKKLKKYLFKKAIQWYENQQEVYYMKQKGSCPCCDEEVFFIAKKSWLRDNLRCSNCNSIPRERALMQIIDENYPNWRALEIHESSPGDRGHSVKLKDQANHYTPTQFFLNIELGSFHQGIRCEDLEQQTFGDNVFDLVITSDVMEHIYDPEKAFKEIHRTLKPGGAHIFSVPIINKHKPTQVWATKGKNGEPNFLFEPEWHGNPVDKKGSPVTMHRGFDIVNFIENCTDTKAEIIYKDDLSFGIRAEYIEIIVAKNKQ